MSVTVVSCFVLNLLNSHFSKELAILSGVPQLLILWYPVQITGLTWLRTSASRVLQKEIAEFAIY